MSERNPYAKFLDRVEKPSRYTGAEHGSRKKEWGGVLARVCLAFPDIYDIGMSHLGFRMLYKILNESPEPANAVAPDIPEALSAVVMRAMEKDLDRRYSSMEEMRADLQTIYRQLMGSSARFTTAPRLSQGYRPTAVVSDPDATIATPNKGMLRQEHITPPSGALARVPAPHDRTPTSATAALPFTQNTA